MATDRLIQTSFVLQRDEFAKAQRIVRRNLPTSIRAIGWLQCALLLSLMFLPVVYRPNGELQTLSLLVLALVWLILLTGQVATRAVMNLQFRRMEGKEIRYEFDEMGFTGHMPDGESRLSWAGVDTFLDTDALFVLPSGILFYTIPKRALSPENVRLLRELLADKLPARKN